MIFRIEHKASLRAFRRIGILSLVILFVVPVASCTFLRRVLGIPEDMSKSLATPTPVPRATPPIPQLQFGNPTNASHPDKNNYLVLHQSHALSYNDAKGTLNWIAWRTTRQDLGKNLPRPLFQPDKELPENFRKIQYYDYSGGGFDRGHMVPSADRFGNREQNAETFLMTNIVPQTTALNQFPWQVLEAYSRSLVYRGAETYTFAGVYGEKGSLRGRVTVPTNCWKVILVLSKESHGVMKSNARVIAVDMPNINGIEDENWEKYITTVRDIESKTGMNLFNNLPQEMQDAIETKRDYGEMK